METLAATKVPTSSLIVGETIPPTTLPGSTVALVEQVQPPKPSRFADAWQRAKESPHGRTLRTLAAGMGGFTAGVTPPVVLAGIGYAIGTHNAYELSPGFGIGIGLVAGLFVDGMQFGYQGLVETFKKLGHKHPNFASCVNAVLCTGLPAAGLGMAASHYTNGGWGVAAGVVGGVLGAIYCEMVQDERRKDAALLPAPKE